LILLPLLVFCILEAMVTTIGLRLQGRQNVAETVQNKQAEGGKIK